MNRVEHYLTRILNAPYGEFTRITKLKHEHARKSNRIEREEVVQQLKLALDLMSVPYLCIDNKFMVLRPEVAAQAEQAKEQLEAHVLADKQKREGRRNQRYGQSLRYELDELPGLLPKGHGAPHTKERDPL